MEEPLETRAMSRNSFLMSSPKEKHNFSAVCLLCKVTQAQQHCLNDLHSLQPDVCRGWGHVSS